MSYSAKREAFNAVSETCPAINKAGEMCMDSIRDALYEYDSVAKAQTSILRDALIDAFEVIGDLEDQLSKANSEIESLRDELKEVSA